jgi:hypothetical protein
VPALARRAEAAVLVAAGVLSLLFLATLPLRFPSEPDDASAAQAVAQEKQPGDVVLLHPWWTERARLFLPEDVPVVGYLGSDGANLERAPRIWVLSQPGLPYAGSPAFWDAFRPGRAQLGEERRFGAYRLSLHRNGRFRPTLFSAVEAFATARVYLESSPGVKKLDCVRRGQGFECPGTPAHALAIFREVKFEPRRCLSLAPPGGTDRLVVELPGGAPAANRLSLEAGLVWEWASLDSPNLRPVRAGVEDGRGAALAEVSLVPGHEGFVRALRPDLQPTGPLKVWVSTPVPDARETCVDVLAQGPAAGGGT